MLSMHTRIHVPLEETEIFLQPDDEVARRVRAMPGGHVIRLVALTGYGQAEDRRRALDAGFDDHLVKPVEPERLQQVLAMAAP